MSSSAHDHEVARGGGRICVSTMLSDVSGDEIIIRPARPTDVDALARIQADAAIEGYRSIFPAAAPKPTATGLAPSWRRLIEDDSVAVLVAAAPQPVGSVVLEAVSASPTVHRLTRLYVDPSWWGHGIGGLLHDSAVHAARSDGAVALELWVLEDNVRARSMYERRNWTLTPDRLLHHSAGVVEVNYHRHVIDD